MVALEIWKFEEAPVEFRELFPACNLSAARWLIHTPPDRIEEVFQLPFLEEGRLTGYHVERRCVLGTHRLVFLLLENRDGSQQSSRASTAETTEEDA